MLDEVRVGAEWSKIPVWWWLDWAAVNRTRMPGQA